MLTVAAVALGLCRVCLAGYDPAIAATLLSAGPGTPLPDIPAEVWPGVRAAAIAAAAAAELYDPRGEPDPQADCDLFDRRERFAENLDVLRERRVELADAPPLGDAFRLPPPEVIAARLDEYWVFRKRAEAVLSGDPGRAAAARRALAEADRSFAAWSAAKEARYAEATVGDRRRALKELRRVIGEAAYRRAELPRVPTLGPAAGR